MCEGSHERARRVLSFVRVPNWWCCFATRADVGVTRRTITVRARLSFAGRSSTMNEGRFVAPGHVEMDVMVAVQSGKVVARKEGSQCVGT